MNKIATYIILLFIGAPGFLWSQVVRDERMALQAGDDDLRVLLEKFPDKEYFVFPENRTSPIQMQNAIPEHWCFRDKIDLGYFLGDALPGEFYTFQLGIYSPLIQLEEVNLTYFDLRNDAGQTIDKKSFRCFNLGGISEKGKPYSKNVNVFQGKVQPFWVGIQIPENAVGKYKGELVVSARNVMPTTIHLDFSVSGTVVPNNGVDEGWRMARLKWLDSNIALDDSLTKPYTPIEKDGLTINPLGRSVTLQDNGLPREIQSYFSNSVTQIGRNVRSILASPFQFIAESQDTTHNWASGNLEFTNSSEGELEWEVNNRSDGLALKCKGKIEYDGFMEYKLTLKALKNIDLNDIQLKIPIKSDVAKYLMGLGHKGGIRPRDFEWRWNDKKNQDAVWIGDVNAGLRCKFKGGNYKSPLGNIYYEFGPLNMPLSWDNNGDGGIRVVEETPGVVLLEAYTGNRHMKKGEELHFDFELLLTPLKTINISEHFATRYIHRGSVEEMLEDAGKYGANVINVHHSKPFNPFINYPYLDETVADFKDYIKAAHKKNIKVKPYYTTREITVNLPEFWALWSLQGEVIFPGPGKDVRTVIHKNGPDPWLLENLEENFIPAWVHQLTEGKFAGQTDLSVITTPDTRWNNFYLEGLKWMVKNMDIDGLYIDDTALGRESLKRVRKILDRNKPGCLIDLHSWKVFDHRAGWNNNANQYMNLFPYIDRIWFGESFRYDDNPSDYWLVEISGIPFGIMGEMLQGGGNPWKGMVYGMTNRIYQGVNPAPVWKFIDKYKLGKSDFTGYWDKNSPIKTNNTNIKATVYCNNEFSIISIANFSHKRQECLLEYDWESLGLNKNNVEIFAPSITDFQDAMKYSIDESFKIQGDKGLLLVIQNK